MLKPELEKLTPDMQKYSELDRRRVLKHTLAYCIKKRVNVLKLLKIYNQILSATEKGYKSGTLDLEAVGGVVSENQMKLIARVFLDVINMACADESKQYVKDNPAAKDVTCKNITASNVPACWFTPPQTIEGKVFYYIHGGGWFTGSPAASSDFCTEIALTTKLRVLSIDYRMYPEHPHPAQIDDVAMVFDWLLDSGITPENIVVAGDSAGGHLVLLLLDRLKRAGKSMPAGAVLMSPPFDLSFSNPEILKNIPSDPVLGLSGAGILIINLLRNAKTNTTSSSDFSPVSFDMTGFPPILLQASTSEILYPDAKALREKAESAGVDITFHTWDGMIHAFQVGARKQYKEVKEANMKIAEFISKVLSL